MSFDPWYENDTSYNNDLWNATFYVTRSRDFNLAVHNGFAVC